MSSRRLGFFLYLLLLGVFWVGSASGNEQPIPKAVNGVLDLSDWRFKESGSVRLDGNWQFYWQRLYRPDERVAEDSPEPVRFQRVPGIWNGKTIGRSVLSGDGYATYRLKVLLNPDCCTLGPGSPLSQKDTGNGVYHPLGLRFMFVETAFKVFVNGQEITAVGTVGNSPQTSKPRYFPHTAGFLVKGDTLDLVIQVSNFHHRKGGLESVILLGCEKEIQAGRQESLYRDVFLFSSILMMGLFCLGIYLIWRKELAPLYFSLLCFTVAVRSIVVGDYLILSLLPDLPWDILLKIEYLTFLLPILFFNHFVQALYPMDISLRAVRLFTLGVTGLSLFVLVTPVRVFSWIIAPYQVTILCWGSYLLFVLLVAMKRGRMGSRFIFLGGVFLFLTSLNDILYNNLILKTGMLFPFGMFVFILLQALVLAQVSADAFFRAEKLSTNLEQLVRQRTRELLLKNNQLKQLLHILCHDLRNPLANIQSIISLKHEDFDLFKEMVPYASQSVDNGLAIIELVREIRVLEEKQLQLKLAPLGLLDLVIASEQMLSQKTEAKSVSIDTQIDSSISILAEKTSFINSVLNNILTNAIKFSSPGASIRIEAERENGKVILSIVDTGIGMSSELLEDLFNPERSVSRPGTDGETGTGFGMPLVKTFVTAYGAQIEVLSFDGTEGGESGTEVRITLKSA